MAKVEPQVLSVSLIQEYTKTEELSASSVFKIRPEELELIFKKEHRHVPDNIGEKRESLIILEKVGMQEGLLQCVASDQATGIIGDHGDLKRRKTFFGENSRKSLKLRAYWRVLLEQFDDPTLKVLLVAGALTLIFGLFDPEEQYAWVSGVSIFFAVLFIALFSSGINYAKEKQFLLLDNEVKNEEVNVVRGQYGLSQPVKVQDVVVGDILLVETGMRIPADCLLLEGMDITVDEAVYFEDRTAILPKNCSAGTLEENNHVSNPDPFLLSDSLVMTGSGRAVVCAVGDHRCVLKLQEQSEVVNLGKEDIVDNLTPLQQQLQSIADQLSKYGYAVGFLVLVSQAAFFMLQLLFSDQKLVTTESFLELCNIFSIACAIVIVAVPEGLPLSISIAIAFSIDTFKQDKLLIKELAACENMGQITEIATGKTATLTKNDMTVNRFFIGGRQIQNREPGTLKHCDLEDITVNILKDCIILNNDSRVEMSDDAMYVPEGNGTEVALLRFLTDNDYAIQDEMAAKSRRMKTLTTIPFGSIRKRQLVAVQTDLEGDNVRVVVKGAPEYVLPACTQFLNAQGTNENWSAEECGRVLNQEIIGKFARDQGLRTLAVAYKDISIDEFQQIAGMNNNFVREEDREVLERDLVFVAGFGINDDLRDGVPEVVKKLYAGGINVRMISGDNLETAKAVARKAWILQGEDETFPGVCLEGKEFREKIGSVSKVVNEQGVEKFEIENWEEFKKLARTIKVLARSTPEDKFAFIVGMKKLGASVAVTADGINDAKALKTANVGFCMGIAGCQVAKESSDVILLDDNFKSVFRAAQWGRNIIDNVRKFIQFQLTIAITTLVVVTIAGVTVGYSPFSVIQLLWINMVMDTLAAISLATEPPHPTELKATRNKKHDKIFTPEMWRQILGQSAYQIFVLIIFLYAGPAMFHMRYNRYDTPRTVDSDNPNIGNVPSNSAYHLTFLFNLFMMMSLFNQINCRKLNDVNVFGRIFNNWLFLLIIVAEFTLQVLIVELGLFSSVFAGIFLTTPLPFSMWLTCVLFGASTLGVSAGLKFMPPQYLERFNIPLKEEKMEEEDDLLTKVYNKISRTLERSETERLLE